MATDVVKQIRRATRRRFTVEEKLRYRQINWLPRDQAITSSI